MQTPDVNIYYKSHDHLATTRHPQIVAESRLTHDQLTDLKGIFANPYLPPELDIKELLHGQSGTLGQCIIQGLDIPGSSQPEIVPRTILDTQINCTVTNIDVATGQVDLTIHPPDFSNNPEFANKSILLVVNLGMNPDTQTPVIAFLAYIPKTNEAVDLLSAVCDGPNPLDTTPRVEMSTQARGSCYDTGFNSQKVIFTTKDGKKILVNVQPETDGKVMVFGDTTVDPFGLGEAVLQLSNGGDGSAITSSDVWAGLEARLHTVGNGIQVVYVPAHSLHLPFETSLPAMPEPSISSSSISTTPDTDTAIPAPTFQTPTLSTIMSSPAFFPAPQPKIIGTTLRGNLKCKSGAQECLSVYMLTDPTSPPVASILQASVSGTINSPELLEKIKLDVLDTATRPGENDFYNTVLRLLNRPEIPTEIVEMNVDGTYFQFEEIIFLDQSIYDTFGIGRIGINYFIFYGSNQELDNLSLEIVDKNGNVDSIRAKILAELLKGVVQPYPPSHIVSESTDVVITDPTLVSGRDTWATIMHNAENSCTTPIPTWVVTTTESLGQHSPPVVELLPDLAYCGDTGRYAGFWVDQATGNLYVRLAQSNQLILVGNTSIDVQNDGR